jgi:uncharacterized membrane protein YsdA (DUF1294 family)
MRRVFLSYRKEKEKMTEMIKNCAIAYLVIVNIAGLLVMGIDKEMARRKAWRIPERTLFLVSLLGGSVGTWLGMYLFRHKTKHWYFVVGMPAILLIQLAAAVWVMKRGGLF